MVRRGAMALLVVAVACGAEEASDSATSGLAIGPLPPGPDIWLASLEPAPSGLFSVGTPTNLTGRPGYDNQPHFVPDGSGFWYTVIDDVGQADIWLYYIASAMVQQTTSCAPESEYSATPLPDGTGISVIRVEADSTQRLWRFDHDGSNASVLLGDLAPVGYKAWSDDRTMVLFVLGDSELGTPSTLQVADVMTGETRIVAENVGRSIHRIPGSSDISYVQNSEEGGATIMRLDPASGMSEPLIDAVDGVDFNAWTPDGTLVMGSGAKLYAWKPGTSVGWTEIADVSEQRIAISRLAVSPDGSQIAIVGEPALRLPGA